MNLAWYIFYGLKLGLSRNEAINTPFGEMCDLIACYQIDNGLAVPETVKQTYTLMKALEILR